MSEPLLPEKWVLKMIFKGNFLVVTSSPTTYFTSVHLICSVNRLIQLLTNKLAQQTTSCHVCFRRLLGLVLIGVWCISSF